MIFRRLYMASDHAGFELKQQLLQRLCGEAGPVSREVASCEATSCEGRELSGVREFQSVKGVVGVEALGVYDFGPFTADRCDYPDMAQRVLGALRPDVSHGNLRPLLGASLSEVKSGRVTSRAKKNDKLSLSSTHGKLQPPLAAGELKVNPELTTPRAKEGCAAGFDVSHGKLQPLLGAGVLICGSGQGMCMAANRESFVRAALCWDVDVARLARQHNNANVLCLGARYLTVDEAFQILHTFLNTSFDGGRHVARVNKLG